MNNSILTARVIARRATAQRQQEARDARNRLLLQIFAGAVMLVVTVIFLKKVMGREDAREAVSAQAAIASYCGDRTIAQTAERLHRISMDPETRLALQREDAAQEARCADMSKGIQAETSVSIN